MADHPRSTPSRKPLLQDAPPAPETVATQSRVLVTGSRATKQEAAPVVKSASWKPVVAGLVVQAVVLGAALAWGANYLRQHTTASGTSGGTGSSPSLENALERTNAQISALQRQLDAQDAERSKTQGRLQEMADRMALVIQQSSYSPSAEKPRATSDDASQVAAMLPSVTPATGELILIKERNRLTSYADKAIATGSRQSLQALVEAMMDPEMQHLIHAAQAEFKRVQAYYDMGIGIDPGYTLPVRELFKDSTAAREADLTPAQLHGVLQDPKLPWEARLRAAFLLRSSTDPETNNLLLKSLKEDSILDVAKQAQITFENRVGRKFRLFDIPAIEAWWQAQGGEKPAVKMLDPEK
ncbi:hypothetical protein WJU23_15655 [Prosthecobacter sp. SYSU 5D2]|uniref:hypothetical protein n=1 Tax=Prosthecobacter sp. SYSU 5D2 TaxID=3134134 RepID=UPI0031FEDA2B